MDPQRSVKVYQYVGVTVTTGPWLSAVTILYRRAYNDTYHFLNLVLASSLRDKQIKISMYQCLCK